MRIAANGNVGIGNTSPNSHLTIGDGTKGEVTDTTSLEIQSRGFASLRLMGDYDDVSGETGGAYVFFGIDGPIGGAEGLGSGFISAVQKAGEDGMGGDYVGSLPNSLLMGTKTPSPGNRPLQLGAGNVVRLTIVPNGSVGIGNTNPTTALTIGDGTDAVTDHQTIKILSNGYAGLHLVGDYGNTSGEPGGSYIAMSLDGNRAIDNSWIGVTSMVNKPNEDGKGGTYTGTLNNSMLVGTISSPMPLHFGTDSTVRMTISPYGQIGIGTIAPSATLEVANQSGGASVIKVTSTTGNHAVIDFYEATAKRGNIGSHSAGYFNINDTGTDTIINRTAVSHVGIGVLNPSHILHVNGVARSAQANFATSSDMRVKENISPITRALDLVAALNPVNFEYTANYRADNKALFGVKRGFIAQEVEAVLPELVAEVKERVGSTVINDFRVLENSDFVPLLVKAVQELKAANDNLRAAYQADIEALRAEIEALQAAR